MRNNLTTTFIAFALLLVLQPLLVSCNKKNDSATPLIPLPNQYDIDSGSKFDLKEEMKIIVSDSSDEKLLALQKQLIDMVQSTLSLSVVVARVDELSASEHFISLDLNLTNNSKEAYQLEITKKKITLSANSYHGLFNSIQTLRQLLFFNRLSLTLPAMNIIDKPQFSYRGLMLDVSRHFFTVEEIKKTLEIMSLYKLNTFHWHLTDDQGWRIEIEKYPLLTEIGSYRSETMVEKNFYPYVGDGIAHSGFYTQSDVTEIVAYADERFITVIPEIDLPGHMSAAIAAYPELGCNKDAINVPTFWGIFPNILCPKEQTFNFLEDVLLEVIALFPSKKIHLGGDEVPLWVWRESGQAQAFIENNELVAESGLHHYFFQRMATFLAAHNRQAIGWDELLGKGNLENTSVMVWQDTSQAALAEKQGLDIIMSPREFTYLNYYQGEHSKEPLAQCCSLPIDKVYQLSAYIDGLSISEQQSILGIQASLWTEYIKTQKHLEYMLMPRIMALAEIAWTEPQKTQWSVFEQNYVAHFALLDYFGVGYREKK